MGRSRANIAAAEMELTSSTSKEACELWNGQNVVRCQGTAPIPEDMDRENEKDFPTVTILKLTDTNELGTKKLELISDPVFD